MANFSEGYFTICHYTANGYAAGGVTFVSLTKAENRPDLVVVRHCPFSRTRLLSQDTLEPTSRLRLALASLATKECALFVMRCLKELPRAVGRGRTGTAGSFAGELNSWSSCMDGTGEMNQRLSSGHQNN